MISSLDAYRGITNSAHNCILDDTLQTLAEEAFATAIELLACAFVQDFEHGMYLAFNSTNTENVTRVDGAKTLIAD